MKKLEVRVDPATKKKLDWESKKSGAPQGEVVRRALKKYLR